jgi:hypothetical protein
MNFFRGVIFPRVGEPGYRGSKMRPMGRFCRPPGRGFKSDADCIFVEAPPRGCKNFHLGDDPGEEGRCSDQEIFPEIGERIVNAGRHLRVEGASDEAVAFELAQRPG